jgi:ketosteroid isomerase-like protein
MSQQNREVVRQPIAVKAQSRRRLEDHLGLRFPRAVALVNRAVFRLPPRSRLRRAIVRRAVRLGLEASNRGDLEVAFALFDRNTESIFAPQLVEVGFDPVYRGREARIGAQRRWTADLADFRFEPEELTDLGDGRVLVVGRQKGSGLASRAAFDTEWGLLITLSAGRVIHEQFFLDRAAAVAAAGLPE